MADLPAPVPVLSWGPTFLSCLPVIRAYASVREGEANGEEALVGQPALIVSLVLAILVAVFAVQNAGPVALRFGFWSAETSLVVVILVAAAAGAAMASLVGLPGWIRDRRRLRAQARELEALRSAHSPAAPSPPEPPPRPSA